MAGGTPDFALRRMPRQERARQTVEHILETAAELLAEVGIDGFNTNLLADRAEVRVRTVYRYFPNKLAVVYELARRLAEEWDGWFDDRVLADEARPIGEVWSGYVHAFVEGVRRRPGGLAIRAALHSQPELRQIEVDDTRRLASRLAKALLARAPHLDSRKALVASTLLLETAIASLDAALQGPARRRQALLDELVAMQVAYLERLLAP